MINRNLFLLILFLSFSTDVFAGGAVARQQKVRAHQHVALYSDKKMEPSPDPYQQAAEEEAAAAAAKANAKKTTAIKQPTPIYTPSNKVLVSSPNYKGQRYEVANTAPSVQAPPAAPNPNQDLARLLSRFDQSSEMWMQISDMRIKIVIIERYLELYRQNEIYIRKPSIYYANLINTMAASGPSLLLNPFDRVLMIAAVTEYDFDNGENPDTLAMRVLGEKGFKENKKRLGR